VSRFLWSPFEDDKLDNISHLRNAGCTCYAISVLTIVLLVEKEWRRESAFPFTSCAPCHAKFVEKESYATTAKS
jgi:hypothetical protein